MNNETAELPITYPIDQILERNLLDILKYAPQADMVRARVHAAILRPIPPEAQTFEQIKAWIEANIKPGDKPKPPAYTPDPLPLPVAPLAPPDPLSMPPAPAFTVRCELHERESGTCRYSVENKGVGNYRMSAIELLDFFEDQIADEIEWDGMISNLESKFGEMVLDDNPSMNEVEETFEYGNMESTDTSPISYGPIDDNQGRSFEAQVKEYIRGNARLSSMLAPYFARYEDEIPF